MTEMFYDSRLLLVYLAIKYKGDYDKILTAVEQRDTKIPYETALKAFNELPCKVMTILDYDYPEKLLHAYRPPIVLFYYGDISLIDKQLLAVVGSRDYSDYGKECTEKIIKEIGRERVIISGLARGIDTLAHQAAIDNGARTIAVLGSGLDNCYPRENEDLYNEIKRNHLLISEYPYDTPPHHEHFPMRNRIVAALSDAIYVPQVNSYMSGTMISLTIGLTLNKPIYIAPYPPGSNTINNKMINEGAFLADSGEQIAQDVGWLKK